MKSLLKIISFVILIVGLIVSFLGKVSDISGGLSTLRPFLTSKNSSIKCEEKVYLSFMIYSGGKLEPVGEQTLPFRAVDFFCGYQVKLTNSSDSPASEVRVEIKEASTYEQNDIEIEPPIINAQIQRKVINPLTRLFQKEERVYINIPNITKEIPITIIFRKQCPPVPHLAKVGDILSKDGVISCTATEDFERRKIELPAAVDIYVQNYKNQGLAVNPPAQFDLSKDKAEGSEPPTSIMPILPPPFDARKHPEELKALPPRSTKPE